jgi:lysozyme family protein
MEPVVRGLADRPEEEIAFELDVGGHDDPDDTSSRMGGGLEAAVAKWRMAQALETLRGQINLLAPNRSKASDGGIGDAAHASRDSDHNPWIVDGDAGVVTARDFTHDPAGGCDGETLAEGLRASRDPRIKYIIWNRRICASEPKGGAAAWAWRPYGGANPHNHHVHLSVQTSNTLFDSTAKWALSTVAPGGLAIPMEAVAPVVWAERDAQIAALDAAAQTLVGLTPLFQRLTDLQDSADPVVSHQAGELLARYAVLTRPGPSEPRPATPAAPTPPPIPRGPDTRPEPDSYEALKAGYEALFASCVVRPEWKGQVAWHRQKLLQYRSQYAAVSGRTGTPWWFIGIVHALEASFNFAAHLHNGDPLGARTVQVPKGRPLVWNPPNDWVSSAVDAIEHEGHSGQADWSLARALFRFEGYNGFGYRKQGVNSPYLWSFSNHYEKGKYVRDGVYDPNFVSKQCGAAVMLKALLTASDVTL